MLDAGDSRVLLLLAERGPLGVVVDHAGDGDEALRKMILATPGVTTVRVEPDWSSYRVPRSSNVPLVPEESGQALRIKAVSASPGPAPPENAIDGSLRTLWAGGPQRAPASFMLELDQPSRVSQVVMLLGSLAAAFPAQLALSVSSDGSQWETVYRGSAALQAYYGSLRHPKRVPLVFAVERDGVRFVRLEQTGTSKHDWWIAELEVRTGSCRGAHQCRLPGSSSTGLTTSGVDAMSNTVSPPSFGMLARMGQGNGASAASPNCWRTFGTSKPSITR
jgi:hypothetical protein